MIQKKHFRLTALFSVLLLIIGATAFLFIQSNNTPTYATTITTVDTVGDVGSYPSTAIASSDGFARISYYDTTNGDLKFVQCTNALCSTHNITTVDSTGDVGWYTSIALDSNNLAFISYYDATNGDLKFVQCTNAACSTSNITTVDSTGDVGTGSSLKIASDGFARIAYTDTTNADIKFAQCTNAACTTKTITSVITLPNASGVISLALNSSDLARFTYYDFGVSDLIFVQCTNAACSTKNTTTVDSTGIVGSSSSLVLNSSDLARISYFDQTNGDLKFAECTNSVCSTKNITTVDATGVAGVQSSITLASDGFARISYVSNGGGLKFIGCLTSNCASRFNTTVDVSAAQFGAPSIALGSDGFARISYYYGGNAGLNFVQCTNNACNSNQAPSAPDTLFANVSTTGAATGSANPTNLSLKAVSFTAIHRDLGEDAANKYRLQISTNSDFSVTGAYVYDSGSAGTPLPANVSNNARSTSIGSPYLALTGGTTYYWRIAFYDTSGNVGPFSTETATFTTVTTPTPSTSLADGDLIAGTIGNYASLGIGGDGFPRIAYQYITGLDLYYVQCFDAVCGTHATTVLETTNSVGAYISMYTDPVDGFSRISYQDSTNGDLKFIRCTNASCSTKNSRLVDSTNVTGLYTSIARGSGGFPQISYYDSTLGDLKFVQCADADCLTVYNSSNVIVASGTTSITLDSTGDVGQYTSLSIDSNGFPRIAYYDVTNTDLKLVRCGNNGSVFCTTGNVVVGVDVSGNNEGQFESLALDSHNCESISYHEGGSGDLRFARYAWNGSACDSSPTLTTLDTAGVTGQYTSIKMGAGDIPSIAYVNASNPNLRFIRCPNAACTSPSPINLDGTVGSGVYASLIIGNSGTYTNDNLPRVAYIRGSDLYIAVCYNTGCLPNQGPSAPASLLVNTTANGAQTADCSPSSGKPNCTNPIDLASTSLTFSAVGSDVDLENMNKYELQISIYPDFNTLKYDSGTAGTSLTSFANGTRSGSVGILGSGGTGFSNTFTGGVPSQDTTYYWRIKFWDVSGNAGTFSNTTPVDSFIIPSGGTTPILSVLDALGTTGQYPSVAVDQTSGLARIAYSDATNSDLRYIQCTNIPCSTYTTKLVDGVGFTTGAYTSIALGTGGIPQISYYDINTSRMKLAICNDLACSSPTIVSTFAGTVVGQGQYSSIAIGSDNLARIAHYGAVGLNPYITRCLTALCATSTTTTIDASAGDQGQYISLVLSTAPATLDFPRVSYYDATVGDLIYVKCGNVDCTGSTPVSIDTTNTVGQHTSIGLTSTGIPIISYYYVTGSDLRIVVCGSDTCSSGNTITTLDSINVTGQNTSLKIGSDDRAAIAYYANTSGSLKLARCIDATCNTAQVNTVESGLGSGTSFVGMGIGSDNIPRIGAYNVSLGDLNFAKCNNIYCGTVPNFAPTAPTTLYSNTGQNGAQSGLDNPTTLNSTNVVFSAIYNDPNTLDTASKYELQIATNNSFSGPSIVYDSENTGLIGTTLTLNPLNGARSTNIPILANGGAVTNIFSGGMPTLNTPYYWRIRFWDNSGAQGAFSSDLGGAASFIVTSNVAPSITTLDSVGDVGQYTSNVVNLNVTGSDGFSRIAYYDTTNADLKFIQCTNSNCLTRVTTTVDSTNITGQNPSISMGADGFARIAYKNVSGGATNDDPILARCTSADCSSRVPTIIDSTANAGVDTSIAMDNAVGGDGFARVLYTGNNGVFFARCTNANCSTSVVTSTVFISATSPTSHNTSMTLGADHFGRVSYYQGNTLNFMQCTNANCSTRVLTVLDNSVANVGSHTWIAMGSDGFARISYYDVTNGDLKFIQCTNDACTAKVTTTVDSTGNVGQYTSLSLGPNDFARISYYDVTNGDLKYAQCGNASCSTSVITTLDSVGNVGQSTSLSLASDGSPRIAYYDVTNGDLKYAQCGNDSCTPNIAPTTPTVLYVNTTTNGAQSGVASPATLASTSIVFSAIHHDTDGDAANKYELQIDNNSDFSSVLYDSENTGLVGTTLTPNANNGARSTDIAILVNGGAVTNLFSGGVPSTSTTYYWRIRFWDTNGARGDYSPDTGGAASFYINSAPTTPTVLYVNTTTSGAQSGVASPATLASTSVVFSAVHHDADGDAASEYELQIDNNSDFSSVLYDSENTGLVGTTLTPNANDGARSTNIAILANGGAVTNLFSGGVPSTNTTYYWRIRFWDARGARGDYSPDTGGAAQFMVVIGSSPTAPTSLYANTSALGAQLGLANPTTLSSSNVVFSAINNDPDGDIVNKYELQIDDDDTFSSVLYDSENTGLVGTNMTATSNGSRTPTPDIAILSNGGAVTNTFSGGLPSVGITYYWRIRFWDTNGNRGAFSPSGTNAAYFLVPGVSCVNAPSGLVSWWPADNNTTDRQGSNSGQLSNGATFGNGKVLRGFSFDGINDSVNMTDTGLPSGTQDRTIVGWLKTGSSGEKYFFSYGTDVATQAFAFGILDNKLTISNSGTNISSASNVNDSTFHHVAVTYNSTGDVYKLYIDGVLDGTGTMTTSTVLSGSTYLGRYLTASNFFAGILDEPAIFNRVLSSSEINSLYQANSSGICKPITGVTSVSNTQTTQKTSATGNQTISFSTPSGAPEDATITLTFPASFNIASITEDDVDLAVDGVDLTTAATCSGSEKASVAVSGQTLTFTICNGDGGAIAKNSVVTLRIGTNATVSGTGVNQITNPSTVGSYTLAIGGTFGDVGSIVVPVTDSDQVGVGATVSPTITFDIDSALTDSETSAPYTIALGSLTPSILTTSNGLLINGPEINSIFLDLNSNAFGGASVTVFGTNGGLYSPSKTTLITPATAEETIVAGQAKFGLCVAAISQTSGLGTFSASPNYDADGLSNCTTTNGGTPKIGKVNTTPTPIVATNGTISGGRVQILAKASVTNITPASNDYQEVLTFIATGTF